MMKHIRNGRVDSFCLIVPIQKTVVSEIDLLLAFNGANSQKQVLELFKIKLISPTTHVS